MSDAHTIFCSKCGAPGQTPDSYCRSCGEWLPDMRVARRRRGRIRMRTPEERHRRIRLLEALSAAASLTAAVLVFTALGLTQSRSLLAFAADLCIVIFVFQVVAFIIGRGLQKRAEKGRDELPGAGPASPPQLAPADASQFVRPPSVTEHTTELLEARKPNRRDE